MNSLTVKIIFFSFLFSSTVVSAKDKKEEVDMFSVINAGSYIFEAESLTSASGFHKNLMSEYTLIIENDSAIAYLPFFGRSFSGAYGGNGAIEFSNIMDDYSVVLKEKKKEKNNLKQVSFSVKEENELFSCNLSISKSGMATLNISSNNRQSVTFSGEVVSIEDVE